VTKLFPSQAQPRKRKALKPDDIDKVAQALMTLAQELWVVKDRQMVTEAVLAKLGIDISEEISLYQPDLALDAKLCAARQALVLKLTQDITGLYEPLA